MENKGIYAATLTAFKDGKLDIDTIRAHSDFLIRAGVSGLSPAGTTGEFLYLSATEKKELFSALIDATRDRARLLCCPWDADMNATAELCRYVSDKGADGIFLPPPIYYTFSEHEIIEFYRFVKANSSVPLYCYHIPKYSNNEISLSALATMADHNIVAGIKDSSSDEQRIRQIVSLFGDMLDVFAGGDHFVLAARKLGANGFITALGNIYPELFVETWTSASQEAQRKIDRLRSAIKGYGGIPALKYLASKRGFVFGCRLPFKELDEASKRELDTLVEET